MKTSVARHLLRLNRNFYNTFAEEFSDSRSALQPGISEALRQLGSFTSLLDVGCGDGRVGRAVQESVKRYVGVDFSRNLLNLPVGRPTSQPAHFTFLRADLASPHWIKTNELCLSSENGRPQRRTSSFILHPSSFDAAVCFSALHHIPGARRRLRLLREIRSLLKPRGGCAISVWQFLHVPRLRRKIAPWAEVGLAPADVDAGDYLLDWQRGGRGLRYVHHFDETELVSLCERAGFTVRAGYRSDGHASGRGNMGLYVILEKKSTGGSVGDRP